MAEQSSVFDMIGPVMIGPSSSHTAGVVRIGRVARKILGKAPETADITFYNSFARTYEGHGSDRAIIAGLMDFKTDDDRIKTALDLAKEAGFQYKFKSVGNASVMHPNTVKVVATSGDRTIEVVGESRGGGVIKIGSVNGFGVGFNANLSTMIIMAADKKGAIAFIATVLANEDCNIASMAVNRKGKNDRACHVIEMDSKPSQVTIDFLKHLSWINEVIFIPDIDF
ncbi:MULTISPECIES: L-serine ammonia-lyase, iron-sulfur-dependent subunit beta [Roseivirga]|jgi:L-serine dehydratase|uniref:L-serine dehydratase n=1 Tax=Roseivirga thermotolerans TaxID=1758176 RepID=A0ABQ3I9C4_9BACT|nr:MULTISPECIES: L-serine ammonia-lyase, iron-sulfur-dependent subunit beta [Roseivirga]MEC7754719.1 L-serine ammonia-lyase, iron-sulfur-dependent subunit beta [Bacteroidota bacterium]GHE68265.1 L-serine dehydratase, iron-sulfur-dependent subunit beta [Roseivirga thermotolerans]|tara:strand:- start:97246 stop:97923 length:678 start_codon:yes stop_codon:yes gene_type:complete